MESVVKFLNYGKIRNVDIQGIKASFDQHSRPLSLGHHLETWKFEVWGQQKGKFFSHTVHP